METANSITLVIPTYNRGNLIAETIKSAINQTVPFAKIIVVDDGSTDNTSAVLSKYSCNISVIRTENRGVQEARNCGVLSSSTELIALLDSDDLLEPNFVELMLNWMSRNTNVDIAFANFITFDHTGNHKPKLTFAPSEFFEGAKFDDNFIFDIPDLYRRSLNFQPFFPTGTVVRKEFFIKIGGYNPIFNGVGAEDWEFTLRAIENGEIAVCTTPLTKIRKHFGNDSRDALRMSLGESYILEFALKHHSRASSLQYDIIFSINKRRLDAFNTAFARGDFIQANSIIDQIKNPPRKLKFFIKRLIASMPSTLRKPLWMLTQI